MESSSKPSSIQLKEIEPFSLLSEEGKKLVEENLERNFFEIGERICREDEVPYNVHIIVRGEARILVQSRKDSALITLEKIGTGALIGWVGLLRGSPCETIQTCKDVETVSLRSDVFVRLCATESVF